MIDPSQLFIGGSPEVSRNKKISCKDEKSISKYVAENPDEKLNCKIRIDNGLIKDNKDKSVKRCDYGLWVEDGNRMILIELKGSDVNKAVEQLFSTHDYFKSHFGSEKFSYSFRIVPTRVSVPNLKEREKQFKKLIKGCDIIVKEKLLKEKI